MFYLAWIKKVNIYLGTYKPELIFTLLNSSLLTHLKPIKMKTKKHLPAIFGSILALFFILGSCSSPKMTAVSCPEFPNNRYNKIAVDHNRKKNKTLIARQGTDAINRHVMLSRKNQVKYSEATKESDVKKRAKVPETVYLNKSEYSEALTASADNSFIPGLRKSSGINLQLMAASNEQSTDITADQQTGCDTIILKSGSKIIGKVEEIGLSEIKYRRCDNINGPVISIAKSGVNRILYVNGSHEVMVSDSPIAVNNADVRPVYNTAPPKTNGLGLAGFISSLAGLFVAGILLGSVGVIFGGISLVKINREPGRYKGKGLSIASIIIGIIAIAGAIYVMSVM
jgi:hypothetical protein